MWWLISIYRYVWWYLFYSWVQCYRALKRYSADVAANEGVAYQRQLRDVLVLALLHSTPPRFYYRYRLYNFSERAWLNFIFTHELPNWHNAMSPDISQRSRSFLNDKLFFAEVACDQALPIIQTKLLESGDDALSNDDVFFCRSSLFFKPRNGSRRVGCYALLYCSESDRYALVGNEDLSICNRSKISSILTKRIQAEDYIVQPLLRNHDWFENRLPSHELVTIRLITFTSGKNPYTLAAVLEVPLLEGIYPLTIDVDTGQLSQVSVSSFNKTKKEIDDVLVGETLPDWCFLKRVAEEAHSNCMDVMSVGWDLALTGEGMKLLEGNINWGVEAHQCNGESLIPRMFFQQTLVD